MGAYKQVIVVRTDLEMGKGKIAAQVGHACVLGANRVRESKKEWYERWIDEGQEKVIVKVRSLEELEDVKKKALSMNIPVSEVTDAGHTQIERGTKTCLSVGPAPEEFADRITGDLKLL